MTKNSTIFKKNTIKIINIYGAPGAGKTSAALGLTYKMKLMGLNVEKTDEFFKELIFEKTHKSKFGGQLYILGEQNRRLARLEKTNFFAVTDCPLPLISFYTKKDYIAGFNEFVINLYSRYDNINYLILRKHKFEEIKRIHNETKSIDLEKKLKDYLFKNNIEYTELNSTKEIGKSEVSDNILNDLIAKNIIKK